MTIKFYKIYADKKQVVKDANVSTLIATVTGNFKSDCDILNPVVELEYDSSVLDANYMEIGDFGRFYYVDPPVLSTQRMIFTGHVDVLHSWWSSIKQLDCVVSRQENQFNLYLNDGYYHLLQKKKISSIFFPNSFTTNGDYILTVGGNQ